MARRTGPSRLRLGASAVLVLAATAVAAPAAAEPFPVDEPFDAAAPADPAWRLFGGASLSAAAPDGEYWLRLVDRPAFPLSNSGAAVLDEPFGSDLYVEYAFDYAAWGGGGADGFTFFLMDGAEGLGSFPGRDGGNLGYRGLNGAFVGVGFDQYGGFSASPTGPGASANTIALRGGADTPPTADENRWPYLTGFPQDYSVGTGDRTGARHVEITQRPGSGGAVLLTLRAEDAEGVLQTVFTDLDVTTVSPWPQTAPESLRFGFTAAIGGLHNFYEIRDLTAIAPADLAVTKGVSPTTVEPGERVTFTVVVTNDDTNPVVGAQVLDTLPAGFTDVTWTCTGSGGGTCAATSGAGVVVDPVVDLPRDASATLEISATASPAAAGTTLSNTVSVTAPPERTETSTADNTADADVVVLPHTDLTLTKTLTSADPATYGDDLTYDVVVENGSGRAAEGVVVTDDLPVAVDPTTVTADGCAVSDGVLTCDVGTLEPGATWTTTITGTVAGEPGLCASQGIVQRAEVVSTTPEENLDDNVADVTTPCVVPVALSVTKTGPEQVVGGDELRWEVVVTNDGPAAAPGTVVGDVVPDAVTGVTWTCTVSDGSVCEAPSGSGNDVSTTATVPAGGTATVVVTGTAPPAGGMVTNTATVEPCAACVDGGDGPHEAAASTTVVPAPAPGPGPGPGPQQPGTAGPGLAATGVDLVAASAAALVALAMGVGLALHGGRARRRT